MSGDPLWINAGAGVPEFNANELRQGMGLVLQYNGRAMGARQGVRPGGDELFTSIAGSTITVRAGHAVIDPALTTTQGPYWVKIPVDETHTLTAADPTNPRKDITICRVYDDDEDSSGNRFARTEYLVGLPNPSPSEPTVPPGAIRVATIDVPASGGGSPVVTDRRVSYLAGPEVQVLTSSGSFVKANYPWARRVRVRGKGGGGGSGGCDTTAVGQSAAGGSGAEGGYVEKWINIWDLAASETVTVGAAGTAGGSGSAGNGGTGGTSSFGSHCSATGGGGALGGAATSGNATIDRGSGGSHSGGDFGVDGADGISGVIVGGYLVRTNIGGGGGPFSATTSPSESSAGSDGRIGRGYGGGAAGSLNTSNQGTARSGAAGAPGVWIVEIY